MAVSKIEMPKARSCPNGPPHGESANPSSAFESSAIMLSVERFRLRFLTSNLAQWEIIVGFQLEHQYFLKCLSVDTSFVEKF